MSQPPLDSNTIPFQRCFLYQFNIGVKKSLWKRIHCMSFKIFYNHTCYHLINTVSIPEHSVKCFLVNQAHQWSLLFRLKDIDISRQLKEMVIFAWKVRIIVWLQIYCYVAVKSGKLRFIAKTYHKTCVQALLTVILAIFSWIEHITSPGP